MTSSAKYFIQQDNTEGDILACCRKLTHHHDSPESAVEVLKHYVSASPNNQRLWSHLSDYLIATGEIDEAKSAAQTAIDCSNGHPHVKDLITAQVTASLAIVDDSRKLLFVSIPKCGSSTIKNFFTFCMFNESYGETVHFRHPEIYRLVHWDEFTTKYKSYFKFSVYRDPISRVFSYYKRNVYVDHSLVRDACGANKSNNLATKPGVLQALQNFHDYRRVFTDFRHHTDPITGYLGEDVDIYDRIFDISECDEIKKILSERYEKEIKISDSMVSKVSVDTSKAKNDARLLNFLSRFYSKDYIFASK